MNAGLKIALPLIVGIGIGVGAAVYSGNKLTNNKEPLKTVEYKKEVKVEKVEKPVEKIEKTTNLINKEEVKEQEKIPSLDFEQQNQEGIKSVTHISFTKDPNFYSYEEYNELRDKEDPKKENNVLFQGRIINVKSAEPTSDYKSLTEKYLTLKDEELLKQNPETINQLRLISYLTGMTGFSFSSDLKDINHTLFVFIDFGQNLDKQIKELTNLFNASKEKGYNVIVYPIALQEENERDSYTWLKTMSISSPEELLKLNEKSFKLLFPAYTTKEYAKIFQDGVNSNNLIYVNKIGLVNPFTVLKLTKNEETPYLFYHDMDLTKEQIIDFINK